MIGVLTLDVFYTQQFETYGSETKYCVILKEAIALCDDVVNLLLHAVELWDREVS